MKRVHQLSYSLWLSVLIFLIFTFSNSVFASTTVNLIATNDMHGVLEESDTAIGVAQASAIKNSTENALLIDSGDATQGTTLATINKGADIIRLMNAAGYDCMVAGNHEFDYGSEQLLDNAKAASFPILSANALTESGTLLPATHIIEKAGKTIGFVGITTSTTNTSTNPNLRPGVTFGNEITAAKKAIASLRNQVDTIVLLTHLGDNETVVPVTSAQLLDGLTKSELSQVSAVLDGHSHTIESEPYVRDNLSIPIIQDQTQLTHIGKVALTFNDDGSVSATEEVMDYTTAMDYPLTSLGEEAKESTTNTFSQVKEEQDKITSEVIGQTVTPLWGGYIYWDYAEPRIVETNFGDLVTDAYRDAAQKYVDDNGIESEVLGIVNGGGISNSINPGEITYGDILNAFNHGNMMVVLQTTPAELYKVLENGLKTTGQNANGMLERESVSGSFIQCSGFTYSYDPAGAEGSKVTNVTTFNGKILSRNDNSTQVIIGTQNYVQTFFDEAELLVQLGGEDTIISDYISSFESPIDMSTSKNRILIANDKSPYHYSVNIPVYDVADTEFQTPLPYENVHIIIDNGPSQVAQTDQSGNLAVTLTKGPHTIELEECEVPVYVNNYSGSGIEYTKPGYYGLRFSIEPGTFIPCTSLSVSTRSVDLATRYGSNTQTVMATPSPVNTTDPVTWTSTAESVATVIPNGNSAVINAVAEGRAIIIVSCGSYQEEIQVIVSDNPIVATGFYVDSSSPDSFKVVVEDVHPNRALTQNNSVGQVAIYTWSDSLQNDMNCKIAEPITGTQNYSYTFPVNDNAANNFYIDASNIYVNIYASGTNSSSSDLIGVLNYNYSSQLTMPSGLGVTAYCSNLGFIHPTFTNNTLAGAPNLQYPLEGIRVSTPLSDVKISYSVYVEGLGWMPTVSNGYYAGTMHQNRPIEAIKMKIAGSRTQNYTLSYQTVGIDNSISDWCSQGQIAGTIEKGIPIKGITIKLEKNS